MDAEAELGDIPDEFLDPITCERTRDGPRRPELTRDHARWPEIRFEIMEDPVTMPTSGTVIDRPTIVRLLSGGAASLSRGLSEPSPSAPVGAPPPHRRDGPLQPRQAHARDAGARRRPQGAHPRLPRLQAQGHRRGERRWRATDGARLTVRSRQASDSCSRHGPPTQSRSASCATSRAPGDARLRLPGRLTAADVRAEARSSREVGV